MSEDKTNLYDLRGKLTKQLETIPVGVPALAMGGALGPMLHTQEEHPKYKRLNEENEVLLMLLRCGRTFEESEAIAKKCADWRENRAKELGIA